MNSVDSNDDWVEPEKKTLLQKIMGCVQSIGFFTACLLFTVIFWGVFIPAFYFGMESRCSTYSQCPYPYYWRYFFWMATSGIWVIIISAAICYYSCVYGRDDSDDEDEEEENNYGKETGEKDQKKCNNLDTERKENSTTGKST